MLQGVKREREKRINLQIGKIRHKLIINILLNMQQTDKNDFDSNGF
jgi:hypothetical protein